MPRWNTRPGFIFSKKRSADAASGPEYPGTRAWISTSEAQLGGQVPARREAHCRSSQDPTGVAPLEDTQIFLHEPRSSFKWRSGPVDYDLRPVRECADRIAGDCVVIASVALHMPDDGIARFGLSEPRVVELYKHLRSFVTQQTVFEPEIRRQRIVADKPISLIDHGQQSHHQAVWDMHDLL